MRTATQTKPLASDTAEQKKILVVDDEPTICWALQRSLRAEGYDVEVASSAARGLELARQCRPAMVFLDVRLPDEDGLQALPKFIQLSGGAAVVIMTAFGDLETAVKAVDQGAADYITKPFNLADISRACKAYLPTIPNRPAQVSRRPESSDQTLVGKSAAMQSVFCQIAFFASSDLSVLITGETGTGKELVAAAIHRHSKRHNKPYLAVAPVSMNPELIESELFGHVRGAFTGAEADRTGLFEAAEGGTILLDEIGDLSPNSQAKLLRVLEQGQFSRVGESTARQCDVRVLAATNCDLHAAVAEGRFREDLFYRLNGMHIHLPPLRQRTEDLLPLCEHFLGQQGMVAAEHIDEHLLSQLAQRPWPGNIRELKNAVCHAAVLARGRAMQLSDFPVVQESALTSTPIHQAITQWAEQYTASKESVSDLHAALLAAAEPSLLAFAMAKCNGSRAKAAELLGIHRGTLRERLKAHGIAQ